VFYIGKTLVENDKGWMNI